VGYTFSSVQRLLVIFALAVVLILPADDHAVAATEECLSGWVALTFDDGPTRGRSEAVLEVLDQTGTPATFFSIGKRVGQNPDLAMAMVRSGHVVANHSWAHLDLTTLSVDEVVSSVRRTDIAYRAIGIEPLRLVRPPFLRTNGAITEALNEAGFTTILETVSSRDWSELTPEEIANRVVSRAADGSIIGLHDGHTRYEETALATEIIVERLTSEGFCFGVLDAHGEVVPAQRPEGGDTFPARARVDEMVWIKYLMGN
jgi:peptidoglycan/xylan/chitin deacetylase (PgdA/CDA1 family)